MRNSTPPAAMAQGHRPAVARREAVTSGAIVMCEVSQPTAYAGSASASRTLAQSGGAGQEPGKPTRSASRVRC